MSSVAFNNQFNLVLDVQDKKPQCFLSDSDQLRRLLVNLVQSAIRYSSDQIVQISVRVQEDNSKTKRICQNRPDCISATAESCSEKPEPTKQTFYSNVPSVKPVSIDWSRFEFPPCTILIVDDLGETHLALSQILKQFHFGWIHIYNVDETLDKVQRYFPDLILMDVCFPGSRQTQTIRQIRDWEKTFCQTINEERQSRGNEPIVGNIPIIAFSSYVDSAQDDQLLASGCSDILHKPLSPTELVTMLAKWLHAWEAPEELKNNVIDVIADSALPSWESKRQEWKAKCERMSKGMAFSEVENFSNEVHQFGEQIHSSVLILWAERLLYAVQRYDLSKMKKMLLQFCDLSIG